MVQGHLLSCWESHGTELTAAGHIASTVKKEITMDSFTQLTTDAVQDCGVDNDPIPSGWVFPSCLTSG